MKKWLWYESVWREMVSGIVFKERVWAYDELLAFCKIKEYLDFYRNEVEEYKLDELEQIISDIKNGKDTTKDEYGNVLEIHSIKKLEKGEEFYLVRKPNSLFNIVVGKKVDELLGIDCYLDKECTRISWSMQMYTSTSANDYNCTIMSCNPYMPLVIIYGTIVFTSYDSSDKWDSTGSISFEGIQAIIQNMKFMSGNGILNLRKI